MTFSTNWKEQSVVKSILGFDLVSVKRFLFATDIEDTNTVWKNDHYILNIYVYVCIHKFCQTWGKNIKNK